MIWNGLKNTGNWSEKDAFFSFSRNGAGSVPSFRKLLNMSKEILTGKYPSRSINTCTFRKMRPRLAILTAFVLISCIRPEICLSQQYHTTSSNALKYYKAGLTAFDYIDYLNAERYFDQAIEADDKFFEAHMMMGDLLLKQRRYNEAAGNYQRAVRIDSTFYMPVFYNMATAEMMSGDYANALIHYNVYLSQPKINEKNRILAARNVKNCEFAIEAVKNPVPFSPETVGEGINTSNDEYWPSITADGQTLMFTRQTRPGENVLRKGISQEDFYISYLSGKVWQEAVNAGSPLNTSQNEGAQSLSSDGSYMFFTACDRPGGLGSCDIFFSALGNGRWSIPLNRGSPVNTSRWESQPSRNADGRMLFFLSNSPGCIG